LQYRFVQWLAFAKRNSATNFHLLVRLSGHVQHNCAFQARDQMSIVINELQLGYYPALLAETLEKVSGVKTWMARTCHKKSGTGILSHFCKSLWYV
jgi:hypothetical protein